MAAFSINTAPVVSSARTAANSAVSSAIPRVPTVPAPSMSSLAGAVGLPTSVPRPSLAGAGASLGLPSTPSLPKLQLPKIPSFPGLGSAGITLGAGPKFLAQTFIKAKTVVPPIMPGMPLNMGMVAGAMALVSAISSGNPGQFLTQLTSNIAGDLTGDLKNQLNGALDTSGVSNIQSQVAGITNPASAIEGAVDSAGNQVSDAITQDANNVIRNSTTPPANA